MNYEKIYNQLIDNATSNKVERLGLHFIGELYVEKHHVIPRAHGGENGENNLVPLTAREHFIAHRLLARIHGGCKDMARAVFFMCCNQAKPIPSRSYDRLRALSIAANSGKNHYGSKLARLRDTKTGRIVANHIVLQEWAKVNDYDPSHLQKTARGIRPHHRGLVAEYI